MSTNEPRWKKIRDELPEVDRLVLVKSATSDNIALAKFRSSGTWDVQPFREAWFFTKHGISEWREIGSDNEHNQPAA